FAAPASRRRAISTATCWDLAWASGRIFRSRATGSISAACRSCTWSTRRRAPNAMAPTAALDHIAFRGLDLDATRATLKSRGLRYRENEVPGARISQIFVHDPDGILIELNFRYSAA